MACMPHFYASICMNAEIRTPHVTLCTLYLCIYCMYVYDAVSLKNSQCMCNRSALKLVTPGYKSVNQCTCMSAEDCRTEVLTLQQQRWVVGGMGGGGVGGRNKEKKREREREWEMEGCRAEMEVWFKGDGGGNLHVGVEQEERKVKWEEGVKEIKERDKGGVDGRGLGIGWIKSIEMEWERKREAVQRASSRSLGFWLTRLSSRKWNDLPLPCVIGLNTHTHTHSHLHAHTHIYIYI